MSKYTFAGPAPGVCRQCSVATGVNKLTGSSGPHTYLCDLCIEASAEKIPRIHKAMTNSLMRQTEERQNSQERVQQLAAAEYEGALAETRQLILSINSVIGEPSNNTEHRLKRATQIGMEISKELKLSTNRAARQKRFNQQIKSLMIEHGSFNI